MRVETALWAGGALCKAMSAGVLTHLLGVAEADDPATALEEVGGLIATMLSGMRVTEPALSS